MVPATKLSQLTCQVLFQIRYVLAVGIKTPSVGFVPFNVLPLRPRTSVCSHHKHVGHRGVPKYVGHDTSQRYAPSGFAVLLNGIVISGTRAGYAIGSLVELLGEKSPSCSKLLDLKNVS